MGEHCASRASQNVGEPQLHLGADIVQSSISSATSKRLCRRSCSSQVRSIPSRRRVNLPRRTSQGDHNTEKILAMLGIWVFLAGCMNMAHGPRRAQDRRCLHIIFSSGSTGDPKGVMPRTAMSPPMWNPRFRQSTRRRKTACSAFPFLHSLATRCARVPLVSGASLCIMPIPCST